MGPKKTDCVHTPGLWPRQASLSLFCSQPSNLSFLPLLTAPPLGPLLLPLIRLRRHTQTGRAGMLETPSSDYSRPRPHPEVDRGQTGRPHSFPTVCLL